jgi:uncharacterized membrane protein HdeD (DUF308 family)
MKTSLQKHWWIMAINGILAILFGALALYDSETVMISISQYFGLLILIGGILLFFGALDQRRKQKDYTLMVVEATVMIILGILIMVFPLQTLRVFLILVGIWALLLGLAKLYLGISLGKDFGSRYVFIFGGLFFAVIGLVLLIDPVWIGSHLLRLFGFIFVILGMMLVYFSFKIKNFKAVE